MSETESDEYLGAFYTIISKVSKQFTAPEEQSVRLTSRQAEIPFTIENQLDNPANVSIHLKVMGVSVSQKEKLLTQLFYREITEFLY